MKKNLLFFALALYSCEKQEQHAAPVFMEVDLIKKMEPYLAQTNLANNLAQDKIANDAGKDYLDFVSEENSLADYPLFYEDGLDAGNGKSWVKFRTGFYSNETSLFSPIKNYGRVSFQLIGKIDSEKAVKLKTMHPYFISGKMLEKGWEGKTGYYPFKSSYIDNKLDFGNITYEITDIK